MPELMGITSVAATEEGRPSDGCSASLALAAKDKAMIGLTISAPCHPGERVLIRHAGLSFTARTGADGTLAMAIPAFEPEALVAAYFSGSEVALARISVPDLDRVSRFAFQMAHPVRFDLRAHAGGQVYAASSAKTDLGPIITLGNLSVADPIQTQVYTFPGISLADSLVTVELRITPETCSRTFQAETVTAHQGAIVRDTLAVALPLCGTSGDILVLKNLVQDPTLAASD